MKNSFTVKIDLEGQKITSKSLSKLADLMAKIHAFDRSSLENGTIDVDVEHTLYPKLIESVWDINIEVHLKTDRSKLELIDINRNEYIYNYLKKCRSIILNKILSLSNQEDILCAQNKLDEAAKELKEKTNNIFIPNKSRIIRNALDLTKINNTFNNFSFKYIDEGNDSEDLESQIIISNNMSEVLNGQEFYNESECYDKNLIIVSPNYYNKFSQWKFKMDGKDISCYIKDSDWINNLFEKNEPIIAPIQYMHATLKNGPVGKKGIIQPYIIKVHKVIKSFELQMRLSSAA